MNLIRHAACMLVLGFLSPAWAVNKCMDASGKVSFQDAPCVGEGEKIDVRPAMKGATPVQPAPSAQKEGAFGASWQRKQFLQTQGIPQARAALERNQRDCTAPPAETTTQSGPLRRSTLPSGNQFPKERTAAAASDRAACDARSEALREQLRQLEEELSAL